MHDTIDLYPPEKRRQLANPFSAGDTPPTCVSGAVQCTYSVRRKEPGGKVGEEGGLVVTAQ